MADDETSEREPWKDLQPPKSEPKVGAVLDRDDNRPGKIKLKPGEIIRIVDSLSAEERLAIEQLRTLGPYKIHDARAQLLEELAGAARSQANAIAIADRYPFLETGQPAPQESGTARVLMLMVVTICISLAVYASIRVPAHPTPSEVAETAALPPENVEKRTRRRGRVEQTPRASALLAEPTR